MEIYVAYKDYRWMMEFTEQMLERVAVAVNGTTDVEIDGRTISFKAPFRRLTMTDAIKEKTGYDITGESEEQIREACKRLNVEIDETMGSGRIDLEITVNLRQCTDNSPVLVRNTKPSTPIKSPISNNFLNTVL